jgi:ribosomal protein S18 acetylase RimI-like enzyme
MVPDRAIIYRAAWQEDVLALVAIVARCDATYADWAPPGWVPPASDPEAERTRLAERLVDPGHVVTVAVVGGEPVGFASIRPGGHTRGRLTNLFVEPAMWGAGIGRGLLVRAEASMRERGYSVGELSTQVGNARARRLYERAGWRDTGGRHENEQDGLEMAEYELELD